MVQVAETTTNRRFAGFFIRNAENANRTFENIKNAPLPIARSANASASAQQAGQGQQAQKTGAGQRTGQGNKPAAGQAQRGAVRTGGNPWAR